MAELSQLVLTDQIEAYLKSYPKENLYDLIEKVREQSARKAHMFETSCGKWFEAHTTFSRRLLKELDAEFDIGDVLEANDPGDKEQLKRATYFQRVFARIDAMQYKALAFDEIARVMSSGDVTDNVRMIAVSDQVQKANAKMIAVNDFLKANPEL